MDFAEEMGLLNSLTPAGPTALKHVRQGDGRNPRQHGVNHMTTKEAVMDKLDEVEDPELELSIVELGLVYDVRFEEKDEGMHAEVDLTLTSPGCPQPLKSWRLLIAQRSNRRSGLRPHQPRLDLAGTRKSTPARTLAWTWALGLTSDSPRIIVEQS